GGNRRKEIGRTAGAAARLHGKWNSARDAIPRQHASRRMRILRHTRRAISGSGGSSSFLYRLCALRAEKVQFGRQKLLHFRNGIVEARLNRASRNADMGRDLVDFQVFVKAKDENFAMRRRKTA